MGQMPLIEGRTPGSGAMEAGRYRVRWAAAPGDVARAQRLRARLFRGDPDGRDADGFDPLCRHMLVEDTATGGLVGTCRLLGFRDGRQAGDSYAAQFYDLSPLAAFAGPMLEIGRFCIVPETRGADVLRLAWGALARVVAAEGVALLFGCASFPGTDERDFLDAFARLRDRHLGPARWRPGVKASDVCRFASMPRRDVDAKAALRAMPPLLRSYLSMGGWVSDHAVRDLDLGTLHVFTGLETVRVPAARRRLLGTLAGA